LKNEGRADENKVGEERGLQQIIKDRKRLPIRPMNLSKRKRQAHLGHQEKKKQVGKKENGGGAKRGLDSRHYHVNVETRKAQNAGKRIPDEKKRPCAKAGSL